MDVENIKTFIILFGAVIFALVCITATVNSVDKQNRIQHFLSVIVLKNKAIAQTNDALDGKDKTITFLKRTLHDAETATGNFHERLLQLGQQLEAKESECQRLKQQTERQQELEQLVEDYRYKLKEANEKVESLYQQVGEKSESYGHLVCRVVDLRNGLLQELDWIESFIPASLRKPKESA